MIESIFAVLAAGLTIWSNKEKRKYIDKLLRLKKEWYAEINKPDDRRDNAVLDNVEFELRLLATAFSTEVAKSNAGDPS